MALFTPSSEPAEKKRWVLRCNACGAIDDARGAGVIRFGARSIGKIILGRCANCAGLRWRRLERLTTRQIEAASLDSADRTWRELAGYVAMGSLDARTAERIAATAAPGDRKREVAAYIAEGLLTPEEALQLLAIDECAQPRP